LICRPVTLNNAQIFILPKQLQTDSYIQKGLRATKLIRPGQVILNELPLIFVPNVSQTQSKLPPVLTQVFLDASFVNPFSSEHPMAHAVFQISDSDDKFTLERLVVERFGSKERQNKLLKLLYHKSSPQLEQTDELIRNWNSAWTSNAFQCSSPLTGVNTGFCLMTVGSWFNHSCTPNARFHHFASNTVVYAIEEIQPGEQIFIDYYTDGQLKTPEQRRQRSQKSGFECSCTSCVNNSVVPPFGYRDETVDWMRERIKHLRLASVCFNEPELSYQVHFNELLKLVTLEASDEWVRDEVAQVLNELKIPNQKRSSSRSRKFPAVTQQYLNYAIQEVFLATLTDAIKTILVKQEIKNCAFLSHPIVQLVDQIKQSQYEQVLETEQCRFTNLQQLVTRKTPFVAEPLLTPIINNILDILVLRQSMTPSGTTLDSNGAGFTLSLADPPEPKALLTDERGRKLIQDLIRRLKPLLPGPWYPVSHFFARHSGHSGVLRLLFMIIRQYELEAKY
jgi:hypothetical protein